MAVRGAMQEKRSAGERGGEEERELGEKERSLPARREEEMEYKDCRRETEAKIKRNSEIKQKEDGRVEKVRR